jgi:hypothetical protein
VVRKSWTELSQQLKGYPAFVELDFLATEMVLVTLVTFEKVEPSLAPLDTVLNAESFGKNTCA